MNKWAMDGNSIEKWGSGGGVAMCSPSGKRHFSIHPSGRDDTYREQNRRNRFRAKLHGRRDLNAPDTKGKRK